MKFRSTTKQKGDFSLSLFTFLGSVNHSPYLPEPSIRSALYILCKLNILPHNNCAWHYKNIKASG